MQVANKQDTLTIDCLKAGVINLVAQPAKRDGLKKAQKKNLNKSANLENMTKKSFSPIVAQKELQNYTMGSRASMA